MQLSIRVEHWPVRGVFAISRGRVTETQVIVVTLRESGHEGRGECVPYGRYGETIDSVQDQIASVKAAVETGISRVELQTLLPAGAARNALDCALWDLACKQKGMTVWQLLGIESKPLPVSFTIGLDDAGMMASQAAEAAKKYSVIKLKLGSEGDEERLRAVREAAPSARLIVDANEGWNEGNLETMLRVCESAKVEVVEQPLPAELSNVLKNFTTSLLLCADESAHTSEDIPKLVGTYQAVNIKLDKAGGLTEALKLAEAAKTAGLKIMVGCHVSTSLSMAPATVVAQMADYVDLDGPLLLEKDREPSIKYENGNIFPTTPELWG